MELSLLNNNVNNPLEKEQNKFLNTTLGKVINTGLDVGIRAALPDLIEDSVISVKNAILDNGLKSRIRYSNFVSSKFRKKYNRNRTT